MNNERCLFVRLPLIREKKPKTSTLYSSFYLVLRRYILLSTVLSVITAIGTRYVLSATAVGVQPPGVPCQRLRLFTDRTVKTEKKNYRRGGRQHIAMCIQSYTISKCGVLVFIFSISHFIIAIIACRSCDGTCYL